MGNATMQATATSTFDVADDLAQALGERLRGPVLRPSDAEYDEARRIWNGMIDKYPRMIARCSGTADVVDAVNFARENDLLLSVRGGGHNVAGNAVCDGGLMIDLSPMRAAHVDPSRRTARVQGGATWGDVDRETQLYGLATPGGVVSETGVAGLTLGGGYGYLRKKYGLSCDNLLSAEMVTAGGDVVTASEHENTELFWGLRGGGGNFGIVTSFEFQLHEVGPMVQQLLVLYPVEESQTIWRKSFEYVDSAPDELSLHALIFTVPYDAAYPEALHGREAMMVKGVYAGPVEEGEAVIEPLRRLSEPLVDFSAQRPYTLVQNMSDRGYPPGDLYYWKSRYVDRLDDYALDEIVAWARRRPSPRNFVNIWHMGGAVDRMGPEAMAFANRQIPYLVEIGGNWSDPVQTDENIAWVRGCWEAMEPYSPGATYLNFPGFGEQGQELVKTAFGANYDRVVALKSKYDPQNLFRMNQNIPPAQTT